MKEVKVKITFEIAADAEMFEGCKTIADSLHEALCRTIYEQDEEAFVWLAENTANID